MAIEQGTLFGALVHPVTKEYIRWRQHEGESLRYVVVRDCYAFMGVKRVEIPSYSRIGAIIHEMRTLKVWREDYHYSGMEMLSVIPCPVVGCLLKPLPDGLAMRVSGGLERLCHFIETQPFMGFYEEE
ncbi:hypothetical protein [Leisingera caerulea]|uniref:hypothetical protein n=1 Tax=Leisingera caerulea TaxID=506591 RepID=UPI0021A47331|nr:hypothetical protein [Leisingera caerulea]UWQ82551.1 hypothetical protein K3726_12720 [Leisingera caerulea]